VPEPHPVLQDAVARSARFVGCEVKCPRYDCDWREDLASAEVVNEYGVRKPMPARCKVHGLPVVTDRIVEVIGGGPGDKLAAGSASGMQS
jgi:hypothetical protein